MWGVWPFKSLIFVFLVNSNRDFWAVNPNKYLFCLLFSILLQSLNFYVYSCLLWNAFTNTGILFLSPVLCAIDFYIRVTPVWDKDQLGRADPEQIGTQRAKGGGAHGQVRHPEGGLLSWVGGELRECLCGTGSDLKIGQTCLACEFMAHCSSMDQ